MAKIDRSKGLYDELKAALKEAWEEKHGETVTPPETKLEATTESASTSFVALTDIEPDPEQPRKGFDDSEQDHTLLGLRDSILQHGVLQPISVRRLDSGKYRIIAGERRWRASCLAKESGEACRRAGYDISRIPVVLLNPESEADRLEMQLVENLARADMPAMDTARALSQLRDCLDPKPSMDDLARRLGRSRGWVHQMLALVSPESLAVADALGVPVDSIGRTDLSRMCGWHKDDEKRLVIAAIRARMDAGESLTRALVDEEEERYEQARRVPVVSPAVTAAPPVPSESTVPPVPAVPVESNQAPVPSVQAGNGNKDQKVETGATMEKEPEFYTTDPREMVGGEIDDGSYGDNEDDDDGGEVEPQADAEPASLSVAVSLPMELVGQLFSLAGETMENPPTPGRIVDILGLVIREAVSAQ